MSSGAPRTRATALLAAVLLVSACGQVSVGEQQTQSTGSSPTPSDPSSPTQASSNPGAENRSFPATGPGTPGPDARAGCDELVDPLHRLATGEGDRSEVAAEVRRLADGTTDNALSAVARRLSGLTAQPQVDRVVLASEWDQVRQLCDLP